MSQEVTDRQRSYTLFMLVLVFTSSHVDRQIMGILGQPIKESLLITDTQLGLLTGIMFAVFYATLGMPMAMWADRNNRRNLISFSVFLWSLMTALCAAATNFMQLLLLRIGVGVGEAGSNPPSHSMIADLYPPEKRSTAMAIFGTGINWGILIGFLVGGWINEWYGWRTAFVVVGLPGIFLAILVRYTVKEPAQRLLRGVKTGNAGPCIQEVATFIWRSAVLRHIIAAGALVSFAGYASVIWVPIYLVRIHGMGTGGRFLPRSADWCRWCHRHLPWWSYCGLHGSEAWSTVAALGCRRVVTDYPSHALSDLYGDHTDGSNCRLCVAGDAGYAVCGSGFCSDSKLHAVGNALGCCRN